MIVGDQQMMGLRVSQRVLTAALYRRSAEPVHLMGLR